MRQMLFNMLFNVIQLPVVIYYHFLFCSLSLRYYYNIKGLSSPLLVILYFWFQSNPHYSPVSIFSYIRMLGHKPQSRREADISELKNMSNIGSWKSQSHCRNNPERNGSVAFLDFCAAVGISTVFFVCFGFCFSLCVWWGSLCVFFFFFLVAVQLGFVCLLFFNMFYFPLYIGQLVST